MPELPNIALSIVALEASIVGRVLERVRLASPFLLRSVDPPLDAVLGRPVVGLRRLGKRIVLAFPDELFLPLHLNDRGPAPLAAGGREGLLRQDWPRTLRD